MVKKGYKTTELGTIPSDWESLPLKGNFDFFQNNTYARDCLNSSKGVVQNIHYGDVLIKFQAILDCNRDSIPFINPDIPINLTKRLVQSGDIIIADTAEDNTVGKATEVLNVGNKEIVSGLHTIFVRPHAGLFAERFLGYFINASVYHSQLLPYIVGTKVSSISKASLLETSVLRPPLPEQRAIATALSDVDGYITALKRLIAKKRDIKKGAMQELLTGKRRLPGFKGKWVEKRISAFGEVVTGSTPSTNVSEYWGGTIPWVTPTDITSVKNIAVSERQITEKGLSVIHALPENTLLVTCIASIGKNAILKKYGASNQQINAIIPSNDTDVDFLYYLLELNKNYLLDKAGQTATKILSKADFSKMRFIVPQKPEQSAIATIFSDMDTEIDALTAKLAKVRNIKQGMMQELLTGRIRLVNETEKEGITPALNAAAKVIPFKSKNTEAAKSIKNASTKVQKAVGHNTAIEDAVILAAVTERYATEQYPLAPFYAQKFPYLLHRHMEGLAKGYIKKAAGPYKPELKYRTALPIGLKNQYVVAHEATYQGKSFVNLTVGDNIVEAKNYFAQWHGDEPLKWLEQFRYIKNRRDELELLTTVDMAMVELRNAHKPITILAIKEIIKNSEEWKAKLKRELFSDDNIKRAVKWSNDLFGTESKP